ncbi:hypothetical protein evm_007224 [Chilo suppressalis]|nr:hypothetical protein evm_007224 [Chilo suppressalis]
MALATVPKYQKLAKNQSPEFDTEQAVERRLLAELARQQHQSEEDRRWLQMQEDNLKRLSNVQLPDTEASEPAPEGVVDPATRSQPRSRTRDFVFDLRGPPIDRGALGTCPKCPMGKRGLIVSIGGLISKRDLFQTT